MCFFKKPEVQKPRDPLPAPEKVADPTEIGMTRAREDDDLFEGVPDMRVDRAEVADDVATGAGLRELM